MSFPPVSNYYGGASGQHPQNFGVSRGQNDTDHFYSNQVRMNNNREQDHHGTYEWPTQGQHNPAVNASTVYADSNSWRDGSAEQYGRSSQPDYYQSSQPAATKASNSVYQSASRDNYGRTTQGLNHLVYASGLESTSSQTQTVNQINTVTSTNHVSSSKISQPTASQTRIRSPVNASGYSAQSSAASYPIRKETSLSYTPSNQMAVNAAAALANVVNHRYNASQQSAGRAASPAVGTSSQGGPQNPRPVQTATASNTRTQRPPSQEPTLSRPSTKKPQQRSSAQHTSSIANLVTAVERTESYPYSNATIQEMMPTFIDPTQVFNPYHREHERKKKEAAEAEAKRKMEEQRLVEERAEGAKRREKEASEKLQEAAAAFIEPSGKPATTQDIDQSKSSGLSSEAAELKAMMEHMIAMKSKDPILFSKLWNDVRGKDVSGSNAPPQQMSPQVSQATLPPTMPTIDMTFPKARTPQLNQPTRHTTIQISPESAVEAQSSQTKKSEARNDDSRLSPALHRNGYRVVIENNPEGLPDLGRYPAERRIRQPVNRKDSNPPSQTTPSRSEPKSTAQARPSETNMPWPEHRRKACAIAAVHLLKLVPEAKDNPITADDIALLLDHNPSYLDLCSSLESRGLKFQRTSFAKELLKNVPDLHSNASDQNQSNHTVGKQTPQPITSGLSGTMSLGTTPTVPTAIKQEQVMKAKQSKGTTNVQQPPAGSKEAAARKRNFSELVDLTGLDDNEDYVMPSKKEKIEVYPPVTSQNTHTVETQPSQSTGSYLASDSSVPLRFDPQSHGPSSLVEAEPHQLRPNVTQPQLQTQSQHKSKMIIAKKLEKSEAAPKSYYDPKTVARDILIASGRHPSERPLNVHLANMLKCYIELDSDISTFDWDAVDPGGPPLRQVEFIDIPASRPKFKLKDKSGTRLSPMSQPVSTEHVKVTRLPKKVRGSPTFPSPAPPQHDKDTLLLRMPSNLRKSRGNEDAVAHPPTKPIQQDRRVSVTVPVDISTQKSIQSNSRPNIASNQKRSSTMEADLGFPKRRGRPPGAKNKHPSVSALKKQATSVRTDLPLSQAQEQEQGTPMQAHHEYKCKWAKCMINMHNIETLRKHVKKRHTASEQQAKEAGHICWWKRCDFLMKQEHDVIPTRSFDTEDEWMNHIEEDHIRPLAEKYGDGPNTKTVGKQSSDINVSNPPYHTSIGPLTRILSYTDAQQLEADRQRYLSDKYGREVTPTIGLDGSPNLPSDVLELAPVAKNMPPTSPEEAVLKAQTGFMKNHGAKGSDQRRRAVETIRAMQVRKEKIGPGIDRGGCTLINEARRSTFQQNPGIARIVDADY